MRKILIVGASSFIGKALIDRLLKNENLQIQALSRRARQSHHPRLKWVKGDLYSLKDITEALIGQDEAYYLIHSASTNASLTQGSARDFELIMADNFMRGALKTGLKHIIYLPPEERNLEVEETLKNPKIKTTLLDRETSFALDVKKNKKNGEERKHLKDVRSVQRFVLPEGKNAQWVAQEYFKWLPEFLRSLVQVDVQEERCTFSLLNPEFKILILEKNKQRSSPDRELLYVVGGFLSGVQERGRLEFREVLDHQYVIAALHEFRPALPWFIYRWSQAIVHLFVMWAFGEHLKWYVISQGRKK